ncbi:MAG: exodeoxyribonuclease III [Candidatus Fermentibacteraceae bacterium]|nr:exodeoxyribonuclease III [Candidatus Fermentibacteraceae bacterium]MBN2607469.1 exodeoxyribonuclease III [Candidatus Fermentibacteraceae bacterium]
MKIATWNVNSIRAREEPVLRWLEKESPDVLCMQETKVEDAVFPSEGFTRMGYHVHLNGQKTWNGVAILSRNDPERVDRDLPGGFLIEQKRVITARFPGITIVNVYVPNGGDVALERFRDKLEFLDRLREYAFDLSKEGPLAVMGDFNVAPEEDDVHDPVLLDGTVCFHPDERKRLREFLDNGMSDVFRTFNPSGKAYSWWDYRAAAFRRNMGMRLDLILLNRSAEEMATSCAIQAEPRAWQKPSDHVPVVLQLEGV